MSAWADAAEVTPIFSHTIAGVELGLRIDALSYPATLPRELQSGLTNRLHLRVSLLDGQALVQQRAVEIAIRYDLWEQTFTVTRIVDNAIITTRQVKAEGDVEALLESLEVPRLFDRASVPAGRALVLRAELLLNPIGQEKLRMIRKWVTENSTPAIGGDAGISASNAIFNRIFEQYADGSGVAAAWRVDVVSQPFQLEVPASERR